MSNSIAVVATAIMILAEMSIVGPEQEVVNGQSKYSFDSFSLRLFDCQFRKQSRNFVDAILHCVYVFSTVVIVHVVVVLVTTMLTLTNASVYTCKSMHKFTVILF